MSLPSPSASFSTRVRINSAPSSSQSPTEADEEHSYEAIFSNPPVRQPVAQRLLPEIPVLPAPLPPPPPVVRTGAGPRLRRTVSAGGPDPQQQQQQVRPIVPLLLPAAPARRRDGLVLLPRPPPIFVPAPVRHAGPGGSPLFRPVQPHASALQPVLGSNHGGGTDAGFSLKERQVARLRMEMQHPAGVRIVLKRKDCINTIALVDALGAVWYFANQGLFPFRGKIFKIKFVYYRVAGWRQKEKPLLYNVFHIGDQIIRVGHCNVSSSTDIHRLLKCDGSIQVEFIVRRMPFGRVFHLRREAEGQSLGLVTEISGAEIREVIPGSLVSRSEFH